MNIGTTDLDQTEALEKQVKKSNRCAWCCGISSFFLLFFAAITPFGMNTLIASGANKSVVLT
jgi:hypothetical protein